VRDRKRGPDLTPSRVIVWSLGSDIGIGSTVLDSMSSVFPGPWIDKTSKLGSWPSNHTYGSFSSVDPDGREQTLNPFKHFNFFAKGANPISSTLKGDLAGRVKCVILGKSGNKACKADWIVVICKLGNPSSKCDRSSVVIYLPGSEWGWMLISDHFLSPFTTVAVRLRRFEAWIAGSA